MATTSFSNFFVVATCASSGSLLLSLCGMVGYFIWKEQDDNAFAEKTSYGVRIKCDSLSMHPDDDLETFLKKDGQWSLFVDKHGQYICKTRNISPAIDTMTEKWIRIQQALDTDKPHFVSCGNRSVAPKSGDRTAYFTQIAKHQNVTGGNVQPKVIWDTDTNNSYIHHNISHNEGELTIPLSGIYFIYASLVFFLNSTDESQRPRSLSLRICRKHYGYEQTLLGKTELYRPSHGTLKITVNVAGPFLLRQDDQVLVRVSGLKFLKHHSKGNSFGLFPL